MATRDGPGPAAILESLEPWLGSPRWWLGFSGGLDSSVLLDLLAQVRASCPPLTAIHVNHQLSDAAGDWARHCAARCADYDVELLAREVRVDERAAGPEAAARAARYRIFEEVLGPNELLLLAHHLDDQVETFVLRLMRGAGLRGLSGMPARRRLAAGELCRPLLAFSRAQLERYADSRGLTWVEDASNSDLDLDRNFIRHRVLPLLEQRWPGYRASVSASMEACADSEHSLVALDTEALARAADIRAGEPVLRLARLTGCGSRDLARLLRRWIEDAGFEPPGRERLGEFLRQVTSAAGDARPELRAAGYALRRYRDCVHLCAELPPPGLPEDCVLRPGEALEIAGLGRLEMRAVGSGGLRLPASGSWDLRLRAGGERCRPLGRPRSQSLKKLLQECALPPWRRERLPLLYADGELAAVADLWICEGNAAGRSPGYELHWEAPVGAPAD